LNIWPFTKIHLANIRAELRVSFEQYGEAVVALILSRPYTHNKDQTVGVPVWADSAPDRQAGLDWLRERHSEETRRHNITMAMEMAITFLVAVEAVPILHGWLDYVLALL
jgi:hypothetical protein